MGPRGNQYSDIAGSGPVRRQRPRGRRPGVHPHPSGGRTTPGFATAPPWLTEILGPPGRTRRGSSQGRVRRGDVRGAILDRLADADEPLNGYQLIQAILDRSEGAWKPSPGSVYPTLAQLLDEGLIEDSAQGRKAVQLTVAGRERVEADAANRERIWSGFVADADEAGAVLRPVVTQTVAAIAQLASTGTPDQWQKASEILAETRRRLYTVLAEGPDPHGDSA